MNWVLLVLFIIIIILFILAIIGLTYRPKTTTNLPQIVPKVGQYNQSCDLNRVTCTTDADCSKNCTESAIKEMKCIDTGNVKKVEHNFIFALQGVSNNGNDVPNPGNVIFDNNDPKSLNNIKISTEGIDLDKVSGISIFNINNLKKKTNMILFPVVNSFVTMEETMTLYINFNPFDTINYENNFIEYNLNLKDLKIPSAGSYFVLPIQFKSINNPDLSSQKIKMEYGGAVFKWFVAMPDDKVCSAVEPAVICDQSHGGVLTWTGWDDPQRMEWTCSCSWPAFASGPDCSQLNPNVCENGTFDWNVKKSPPVLPTEGVCTCNPGFTLVKNFRGVPTCVPTDLKNWYTTYN